MRSSYRCVFHRWENPLIGWTSTADPLENVHRATLNFHTQEDAESFCRKHGWKFEVLSPKEQSETRPKRYIGYGDNFRQGLSSLSFRFCLGFLE